MSKEAVEDAPAKEAQSGFLSFEDALNQIDPEARKALDSIGEEEVPDDDNEVLERREEPVPEPKTKQDDEPSDDDSDEIDDSIEITEDILNDESVKPEPEKAEDTKPEEDEEPLEEPTDSPRFKKRLEKAKERGRKDAERAFAQERAQLEAELKEARQKAESVETVEGLGDAEREELKQLRRRYGLQNDPTVKEKFDNRIQTNNEVAKEILERYADDTIRKELAAAPDVTAYAYKDPKAFHEFVKLIEDENPFEAEQLKSAILGNISLNREKQRYVETESKKADEYFAQREVEQTKAQQEAQQQAEQRRKQFTEGLTAIKENEFYAPIDTSNLEGAKKAEAEQVNIMRAIKRKQLDKFVQQLSSGSAESILEILDHAARRVEDKVEIARLRKRVAAMEERLVARQKAGTPKSSVHAPTDKPTKGKKVDVTKLSRDELMDKVADGSIEMRGKEAYWA